MALWRVSECSCDTLRSDEHVPAFKSRSAATDGDEPHLDHFSCCRWEDGEAGEGVHLSGERGVCVGKRGVGFGAAGRANVDHRPTVDRVIRSARLEMNAVLASTWDSP